MSNMPRNPEYRQNIARLNNEVEKLSMKVEISEDRKDIGPEQSALLDSFSVSNVAWVRRTKKQLSVSRFEDYVDGYPIFKVALGVFISKARRKACMISVDL